MTYKSFIHAVGFCTILIRLSAEQVRDFNAVRELLISSYQESLQMVDKAISNTRQRRDTPKSHKQVLRPRQAEPETLEIVQAAETFERTLQIFKDRARIIYKGDIAASALLSWEDVEQIAKLSGCLPQPVTCPQEGPFYRSISGICNNRQNPLWGAVNTALERWLPAEYEDGERQPKGWNHGQLYNGYPLPPVREVSKKIIRSSVKWKDDTYSQMLVEWGQYIDHDITFTPQSSTAAYTQVDCLSTCENVYPCFPIQLHDTCGAQSCMPFYRSSPACFANFGSDINIDSILQRQQMNAITSFIDASVVYGHTSKLQSLLRDLASPDGRLDVNHRFRDPKGRPYMPFVPTAPSGCFQDSSDAEGERVECFLGGDSRVNEAVALTSLHTLGLREHNRVAEALKVLNNHWSRETVYQETRKIIGALHQIITMRDYVPKIIGSVSFDRYIGPYGGYDPAVNPSASNVFPTAAFRFGHATISTVLTRLNESFQEHERYGSLKLHNTFFSPWRLVKEGGVEPVLRGLLGSAAVAVRADTLMAEDMTEKLVVLNVPQKMDLAALNLQRGRDHGLPGYNDWRAFCGLQRIKGKADFQDVLNSTRVAEQLLKLYKHPDNIDVWVGGLVEDLLPGSRNGPLFSCLIGKQMKALRDGDRFWWEAPGVFTEQQRAELSKSSLSGLICSNSDVTEVPLDAFKMGKYPHDFLPCSNIPAMNLEAWREV